MSTPHLFGTRNYIAGIRTPNLYIDPKYAVEASNNDTGLYVISLFAYILALWAYLYGRMYPVSLYPVKVNSDSDNTNNDEFTTLNLK